MRTEYKIGLAIGLFLLIGTFAYYLLTNQSDSPPPAEDQTSGRPQGQSPADQDDQTPDPGPVSPWDDMLASDERSGEVAPIRYEDPGESTPPSGTGTRPC